MPLWSRFALAALLAVGLAGPTLAADDTILGEIKVGKYSDIWEVRFGGAAFDTGPASPNNFSGAIINAEVLAPSPDFLDVIGSPRPLLGTEIAISDDPIHVVYAGLNWEAHVTERLYLGFSGGGSWNSSQVTTNSISGSTKDLGSSFLFLLQASIGYDVTEKVTLQAFYNHFSNAYLAASNPGLESVGGRLGVRF
tara:strand:- start:154511 stop:155095 length:585 start_codon:yes stop_codon:yes gene_type:complete